MSDYVLQVNLKSGDDLLNITGNTPAELLANYSALEALPAFARFFNLSTAQAAATLTSVPNTVVAPAPATQPAAKSVKEPGLPATEKQIALIQKRGGTVTPGLTKGQASDLIDQLMKQAG